MLSKRYPDLEEPIFCVRKMSLGEKWRDTRFHKNLWKVDERMLLLQAKMDGVEEGTFKGREEGRADEKLEIARNAFAEGATPEFVRKITGLPSETIEKLQGRV